MSREELLRALSLLEDHADEYIRSGHVVLNPPVDEDGVAVLTASLGKAAPQDLLNWLTLHNGESGSLGLLGGGSFLMTAQEIGAEYLRWTADEGVDDEDDFIVVSGPVRQVRASRNWIPVAYVNSEVAFLDYAPAQGGEPGQVIFFDQENSSIRVAYSSLQEMFIDCAEHGSY